MIRRPIGKITIEELRDVITPLLGGEDKDVLIGPGVGEDASVVKYGDRMLVLKSDPISGALDLIGWLSVHVNANDIATKGGVPKWFLASLILPTSFNAKSVRTIMQQIHRGALELGVSVVGGHTEFTGGVTHPIVAGAMIGVIDGTRYFSTKNARPGELLVQTKAAGIEATSIIATDLAEEVGSRLGENFVSKCKEYIKKISIVQEARIAYGNSGVSSLHDCTEGGVITAAYEIAEACGGGLLIWEDKIPVWEETRKLTEMYDLDPIKILSSGSLLITVDRLHLNILLADLKKSGVNASVIGEIKDAEHGRKIRDRNGVVTDIVIPEADPLWNLFDRIVKA